jgi:hypothetical protein
LLTILTALNVDQRLRNDVLVSAGFAPDAADAGRTAHGRLLTLEEAAAEEDQRPWPSTVINEKVEMLAANRFALRLWGIRRSRLDDPVARNVLTMSTERRIAERCLNWDVAIGALIALFKAHRHYNETLEHPSSYFAPVLERVYAGDPSLVRRFIDLWEQVPSDYLPKVAFTYPIIWRLPQLGTFHFHCLAYSVNEVDGLDLDEWTPADARTFRLVERLGSHRLGGYQSSSTPSNVNPKSITSAPAARSSRRSRAASPSDEA